MSDLNDFLKLVAEAKVNTPSSRVKKIEEQVKTNVKSDLSLLFEQLSSARTPQERLAAGEPVSISELPELQAEISRAIDAGEVSIQGELNEVTLPTPIGKVPELTQLPDLDKYLKPKADVPKEEPLTNEFRQVNDKIKFLERWVSQIQNTGPGSGEVNFRYLDDVNRLTMGDSNDNWVLEYDVATKKVQFTENLGPIRTVKFNTAGPQHPLVAGQMAWNPDEDCMDIRHADGSTLQVGLEQHMQVYNGTGSTLANGTVVRFSGVNGDETPLVVPHIANGTIPPLYTVGVLTNNIEAGEIGRATTYGKVRDLNTTGSDVGETWAVGDLLYVSPTTAGKLTKVKPTAPNIVVSVAAVLKVHATEGKLLIRPTIFPRLHYGSFSDTTDQTAAAINTPYAVKYNTADIANGHSISNNTRVVAANSGLYNYQFSLQLSSSNSSSKQVYIWARKNGADIPNSATRITISGNGVYMVAAWNFIVSMNANDYFELMWATSDTTAKIDAPPATAFCPAVPSVILTVTEAAL